MLWDNVYKEWFGTNWEIVAWLTAAIAIVLGVASLILFLLWGWTIWQSKNEVDSNDKLRLKKKAWNYFWLGVFSVSFPIIWPTILGAANLAGVGKLVSGDILPKLLFAI